MATRRRDAKDDPQATLPDFVYRLRRMGYPGNVRMEFPIYTGEDVRWTATIMSALSTELVRIVANRQVPHLTQVLAARGLIIRADNELKLRSSHHVVKKQHRNI
ncbi:MAG: hypothetical protein ACK53W_00030 [Gemmatimonadota bacterium]|jgi:hypothetical protein